MCVQPALIKSLYSFLPPGCFLTAKKALERLRTVFKTMKPYKPLKLRDKKQWYELIREKTGKDPRVCSKCNLGMMRIVDLFEPLRKRDAGTIKIQ
jgi:hypothetical protein